MDFTCVCIIIHSLQIWSFVVVVVLCVCVQESLDVVGDVAYTCETAGHFYLYQVLSRWEQYTNKVKPLSKKVSCLVDCSVVWHCSVYLVITLLNVNCT